MLEIIVETVSGALAAQAGGATQLDLKCDLAEDGLTPSAGLIERVCAEVSIDVLVMIRPHPRALVYSQMDVDIMCADIRLARTLGAKGFILGCVTKDRHIDVEAVRAFQQAAQDCSINYHLAWEAALDPLQALDTMIDLGVASARTSGGGGLGSRAEDRIERIRDFAEHASGQIELIPAGGINVDNIGRIIAGTGLTGAHAATSVRVPPTVTGVVDRLRVQQLREALDRAVSLL